LARWFYRVVDVAQAPVHSVSVRRWGRDRWALVALVLLAWVLRLSLILDNHLHPDEALYGYWSLLIGSGRDPWLATVPVYKPPLLPYLMAGTQAFFSNSRGHSEFALRLPGLAASLLMAPLVASLTYALFRERWTAVSAAMGVALSPLAISFSATAFLDPPMVALGLAACVAAARDRPRWAGLLAGLSFATKQTGLVWAPLVALFQITNTCTALRIQCRRLKSQLSRFSSLLLVIGYWSLVILLVFAWDTVRVAQGAESFWCAGVAGYGGLRLIWPHELRTRLCGWLDLARYLFTSPIINGALLAGLPVLAWRALVRCRYAREALMDLTLISFSLIYLLFHWLWAFPVWDRYLLPLMPVLAVLLGRVFTSLARGLQSIIVHRSLIYCALFTCLTLFALNAARNRYSVGGNQGVYDSIDQVALFLSDLPEGSVVYHHWLGWHYCYYLFDAPVYLAYWPTPAWLAQDVRVFGAGEPRYITFPSWESSARVERALAGVGYGLNPVLTTTRRDGTLSFTTYHVQPLSGQ
jgi:4-amino-4-deoxy-L-arabinose transferase-like glycosyltransferase